MATLNDLLNDLKKIENELPKTVAKVVTTVTRQGVIFAFRWSSGPYSLAELAKKDYPYAKRHGSPIFRPDEINVQSEAFRAGWKQQPTIITAGMVHGQIRNDTREADFLKPGTRFMFDRPIDTRIEDALKPLLNSGLNVEIGRLMRKIT